MSDHLTFWMRNNALPPVGVAGPGEGMSLDHYFKGRAKMKARRRDRKQRRERK